MAVARRPESCSGKSIVVSYSVSEIAHWRTSSSIRIGGYRRCALALVALVILIQGSGCTHFTPYYRKDQARLVAAIADSEIDHRLFLIGDAGEPALTGEPTLAMLKHHVELLPDKSTVVFLGDNVYERGMPEAIDVANPVADAAAKAADAAADVADVLLPDVFDSRQEAERHIDAQIDVVRGNGARAVFVPGNHDWDQFEIGGWDRVLALEEYLDAVAAKRGVHVELLPRGGCPGPNRVDLGTRGRLITLDTQWWLETRADGKPTPDNNPTKCAHTRAKEVRDALVNELAEAAREKRWVIIGAHHPLESEGPHGGHFDFRTHLFPLKMIEGFLPFYLEWLPLPGLGSLVVGIRACCSLSPQDTANRRNRHMRASLVAPMKEAARDNAAPLVFAAGHDHSLQVFESNEGPRFTLVSGLGSSVKASAVGSNRRTLFAHSSPLNPGFVQIDFARNGEVRLAVVEKTIAHEFGEEVYSRYLHPSAVRSRKARR